MENLKSKYNYQIGKPDNILESSDQCKDLGIIMTPDGKFKEHVNTIYKKVNKRINWMLRSFKCRSIEFMRFLWRTY